MWIMLTKRLPINSAVCPPKLSIHWCKPWPLDRTEEDKRQLGKLLRVGRWGIKEPDEVKRITAEFWAKKESEGPSRVPGGLSPNPYTAVAIMYKDEKIRVWDHEYSVMSNESMHALISGEDACYDLVLSQTARAAVQSMGLDLEQRQIKDAAMVDGCTADQATQVSLGLDVFSEVEFPPMGWYRCRPAYALAFAEAEELLEI